MTKYWNGVSFTKGTVRVGDKEQNYVIGMSEEEYNDRSYREYLEQATIEKTREELARKQDNPVTDKVLEKRKELGILMRERNEYRRRKAESPNKKYF